jgi:hypothetical protein
MIPIAATAAQTTKAAWKLLLKVCCRATRCVPAVLAAKIAPAVAPPNPVKTAPASAILMHCPMTREVARKPDALP